MFRRFGADARQVVVEAREQASALGSPTVEAEHLLLAVTRRPTTPVARALAEAGLGDEELRQALVAELEGSLAAVGVSVADFDLPEPAPLAGVPRWGTSAKLALERSAKVADARRDRRLGPGHIVLGVLRATAGTVPRALDVVEVDRTALGDRVAAAL